MNSFLQSPEWEKFQQSFGRKTWRCQDILIIRHDLPFGFNYLYCPRPGMGNVDRDRIAKSAIADFRDLGLKEKSIFVKLEPEIADAGYFYDLGFIKSKKEIQPAKTLILDLTQSENDLLGRMHPKTRYNIRVAQKHDVKVTELPEVSEAQFEDIWKIFRITSQKDDFALHAKNYYRKMIEILSPQNALGVFAASYGGRIVAVNLVIFFGDTATYLHGASDFRFRNLMAPYAAHWHIIQEARKRGFKNYDFWGVSEEKYPGATHFKKGFGGKEIAYPGSFDLILNPLWYNIYKVASRFPRLR